VGHTCAFTTSGSIVCWGNNVLGYLDATPQVPFTSISAGTDTTCGVTDRAALLCWGVWPHPPQD
jgi:hypothetical protein